MKYCYGIYVLVVALGLQSCSREPKVEGGHVVTISPHTLSSSLFYSGTIQPLKTIVVPSPADGVIVGMPFQYGEEIKAGQLLFLVSSTKFLTDYKAALMQYVKAKSDFNNGQTQFSEAKFLHKNQLISDDDFKMKQANYYAAQLALLQAKDALENLLTQLDIKNINFYKLTIADIDKITQAMHLQMSSENYLRIVAPAAGIVLSPSKSEDENKKILKGDVVKQGDVLAVIGDMSGLTVNVKVNELTVNQLQPGQKVKVTGIAFPENVLNGEIERIDRQGEPTGGGMPAFSVQVSVENLTTDERKIIHVGMSAKVEIDLAENAQVMIPIEAVHEKNGTPSVDIYEGKTGKVHTAMVKTGKTTMTEVAILSGLKMGDKIVVPD